ncbi:MAG TPA: hypothetical protein VE377_09150 [Candidatus Dormibacteraeota bacterium]|nr:hypothetical protein [Candidatus Dormibacteraeota bacterium]
MASIRLLRSKTTLARRVYRRALAAYNKALAKYAGARQTAGLSPLPPKFHKGNC